MSCGINTNSIFGTSQQYIKYYNNSLVAVEGPNMVEKLPLDVVQMPYKQILRSRIILKAGQINYLFNYLGFSDNATFLTMVAQYDAKSLNQGQNYVTWSFIDSPTSEFFFSQVMTLSGTADKRLPLMYLTNPSATYSVTINAMVASVDDAFEYFSTGDVTVTNMKFTDIITRVAGSSIDILSASVSVATVNLAEISSITRTGNELILAMQTNNIYLNFIDEYNTLQAFSRLNWLLASPTNDTTNLNPPEDSIAPILYFEPSVMFGTYSNIDSSTSSIYTYGLTFSGPTFSLSSFTASIITKSYIIQQIVGTCSDNRDGIISLGDSNISILSTTGSVIDYIHTPGYPYYISFILSDIAGNSVNTGLNVSLHIYS